MWIGGFHVTPNCLEQRVPQRFHAHSARWRLDFPPVTSDVPGCMVSPSAGGTTERWVTGIQDRATQAWETAWDRPRKEFNRVALCWVGPGPGWGGKKAELGPRVSVGVRTEERCSASPHEYAGTRGLDQIHPATRLTQVKHDILARNGNRMSEQSGPSVVSASPWKGDFHQDIHTTMTKWSPAESFAL
jgi:hypothetical protein